MLEIDVDGIFKSMLLLKKKKLVGREGRREKEGERKREWGEWVGWFVGLPVKGWQVTRVGGGKEGEEFQHSFTLTMSSSSNNNKQVN